MATESVQDQTNDTQTNGSQTRETQDVDLQQTRVNSAAQRFWSAVVGLAMILGLFLWSSYALGSQDPYVQSVLQISGDGARGKEIFKLNCATCHGLMADGEVGPDLRNVSERKSRVALIEQVISGRTPPMPQFQPGEKDMADLLTFLETL